MRLARIVFAYLVLCSAAVAQVGQIPGWPPNQPSPSAGGPVFTFKNTSTTSASGAVLTASIDIGTASADRLVIVACDINTTIALTSVVVNSVTLTADENNANGTAIFSGLVTAGSGAQTITATWASGSFQSRSISVWTATGLSSNLVKQHTNFTTATGTINVTAGDFMVTSHRASGTNVTWSGSTQVPGAIHDTTAGSPSNGFADWTIVSTNASFSVSPGDTANNSVATYR